MSAAQPLQGIELIDCAKANAPQGLAIAAQQCGYGDDVTTFSQTLREACHQIGVEIAELSDLITEQQTLRRQGGVEIAPDSDSSL